MIIVINPIRTLRKITVKALEACTKEQIIETADTDEAEAILWENKNISLVILELNDQKLEEGERSLVLRLNEGVFKTEAPVIFTVPDPTDSLIKDIYSLGDTEYVVKAFHSLEIFALELKNSLKLTGYLNRDHLRLFQTYQKINPSE